MDVRNIRYNEVSWAISKMKNNKSPGEDLITAELLKAAQGDIGIDKIHELLQMVWDSEELPKKGNFSDCNDWRGITLLSVTAKVLAMIILERIYESLDERMNEGEVRFRRGRPCVDQIFVLRSLIEQSVEWRSQTIVNFIGFKKAFDSLHRLSK